MAYNLDKDDIAFYMKTGVNSPWIQSDDANTGVCFENAYTGSGCDSQFNGDLSLTNAYAEKSDGSWVDWSNDSLYILDCNHNTLPSNSVISGSLKEGGTATLDMSNMVSYPKC